tara:strand:+ start:224 stop:2791 length:2568 start_codon:yes stop_codon:yes gene_type:complete
MADNTQKEHYKNLQNIKKLTEQINKMKEQSATLSDDEVKSLRKLTIEHGKLKKAIIANNKERIQASLDSKSNEGQSIKSLGSMYDNLGKAQRDTMNKTGNKFNSTSTGWLKKTEEIGKVNRSIAKLDKTDVEQLTALQNKRNDLMAGTNFLGKDIQKSLQDQNNEADKFASMTESQKKVLEGQHAVLDGIKTTIQGTLETAVQLYGNIVGATGGLVTGLGFVVDKIGQANSELGTTLFQTDGVARKAGVLSFFFEDAVGNAKALSAELGSTSRASFEAQTQIGLMSMNMGISGNEAATLVGSFTRLNGNSASTAADMVATSREFAKQNGIIPSALMSDLAGSAEEFALFGKEGGKNILQAAGYAAKLGVNMKTLSGVAEGLLDFESSITKELELGAMLGKNINLAKARELAYSGDIEGATKETLKQLGGIEAFNKMDYYQKKQTADLLGTSVAELEKMSTNQAQAATMGGVINEKFSMMGEIINGGLNKYLGTGLKGLGGMITASGQLGMGFKSLGLDMGGMVKNTAQVLKNLLGMVAGPVIKGVKAIGGGIANTVGGNKIGQSVSKGAGKLKDKLFAGVGDKIAPPKSGGGADALTGKKSMMSGMSKINMSAVLKGAAAMLIVAGAVFVFGKAVQEFMKVSWSAVGMAVVSMLALVGAVALLGAIMMSGVGAVAILAGAAAMLVIASSVLVLGLALQAIGTGFEMMGTGLTSLVPTLMTLGTTILSMVALIPTIALLGLSLFGLSLSIAGLAASLMFLGTFGLPGLLMLAGIAAVSAPIMKIAGFFGLGESSETGAAEGGSLSEYETNMLAKMDQLIAATTSARDIFLDKDKVTNIVMDRGERNAVNKLQLNRA